MVALLLLSSASMAQAPTEPFIQQLQVNKAGQLIAAGSEHKLALANSLKGHWKASKLVDYGHYRLPWYDTIDDIGFFNKDTFFIIGFLNTEISSKKNYIIRTVNGGQSWEKVGYGLDYIPKNTIYLDNGEAWIAAPPEGIAFTKNYGATWTSLNLPGNDTAMSTFHYDKTFTAIYFNQKHQGIIGWRKNRLTYTENNGESWTFIPTPFDQKKHTKENVHNHAEVYQVALFNDYLVVNQGNQIFYTKRNSINWTLLPSYTDVYTDAENSTLFFKTNTNDFVACNHKLKAVNTYTVTSTPGDVVCKNGRLYIGTNDTIVTLSSHKQPVTDRMRTDSVSCLNPGYLGYMYKNRMYIEGNKIFIDRPVEPNEYHDQLEYCYTLPFEKNGDLEIENDSIFRLRSPNDSLLYYNVNNKQITRTSIKALIDDFSSAGIKELTFMQGNSTCLITFKEEKLYTAEKDQYVFQKSTGAPRTNPPMPAAPLTIPAPVVADFLKALPAFCSKQDSIDNSDPGGRPDFIVLTFKNNNEQTLDLITWARSKNTSHHHWRLRINRVSVENTATEITTFINKIYPGL